MSCTAQPGPAEGSDEEADLGGEPACLLAQVCPECGRFAPDRPPTRCPSCGAEIED